MSDQRTPEQEAKRLWLESSGKLSMKAIAGQLGIPAERVRRWKRLDRWEADLQKRSRGGQPGNQNAKGNRGGRGGPVGNRNGEIHGAYSVPRMEEWSEEERAEIENLPFAFCPLAKRQLKKLEAKQHDLERRIAELNQKSDGSLYLDRTMSMRVPGKDPMEYTFHSSQHSRRLALEGELNRVQGRIIKLLDSIRAREQEEKRLAFDREKLLLEREKASGVFETAGDGEEDIIVEA